MKCKICNKEARYQTIGGYLCIKHKKTGRTKVEPKDRKQFSPAKKRAMLSQAKNTCYYCRKHIESVEEMILDHKTPISRYGKDTEENIAVSCKRCDFIKGNLNEIEFRDRNLGIDRSRPYGTGRGMPKTQKFLRKIMRQMREGSRTKDILNRVLNGERVDISKYPRYVNPRRTGDRMPTKIRQCAKEYDFLKMEGDIIWKCR